MRDEAHRFGITHHRGRREKSITKSQLIEIEGIGEKTIQTLLRKFKSVNNIKKASLEEIRAIAGKAKGKEIFEYFQKQQSNINN